MVISLERWIGKVAVVTGAGSGIGAAVVAHLAKAGVHVVGLDLCKERVEKLGQKLEGAPGKVYALQGDVSKDEDVWAAFKFIKDNVGPVHILVNNAGCAKNATLMDGETHLWKPALDTNILGVCIVTREAIKDMRANGVDGHIVHLNSIAGHRVPSPINFNVYSATKHAVTALTETLRQELNSIGSKIKVSSISPGTTTSGFLDAGGYDENSIIRRALKDEQHMEPEDIADGIAYVLGTPPHVQVHELTILPVGANIP